jgi:hypothetical protein
VIADAEVKLRAGPSDRMPETGTLKKGDLVTVYDEENGWLAVQDVPGRLTSVSWVQIQLVDFKADKPTPQVVVVQDSTNLAVGQIGVAQPITHVRRTKVPAGTVLTVIGSKVKSEDKSWYPVVPPAGDYRYIPKHVVKFEKPANTGFTVRDTTPPSVNPASASAPAASIAGPSARSNIQHPLWSQAEAAERDGRYDDAERLYFQLARAMNEPGGDHDVANLCYTRIHSLREKKRSGSGSTTSNTRPSTADTSRPASKSPTAANDPRDDRQRRTGTGRLVRSRIDLDGRSTYRLEDNTGDAALYVVPAAGVDLERYVGKKVEITGSTFSRQGLSKPYVIASSVEVVP